MEIGGKGKFIKPEKTKFKSGESEFTQFKQKQKQKNKNRDKSVLRSLRQEKEYVT
jgi:DNA-binding GntR family transcriptional regulator